MPHHPGRGLQGDRAGRYCPSGCARGGVGELARFLCLSVVCLSRWLARRKPGLPQGPQHECMLSSEFGPPGMSAIEAACLTESKVCVCV